MRGGADVSHVWARVYTLVRSCGVKCAAARQPVGSLWRFALPCLLLHSSWVTCYRRITRPASPDSGAGKSRGQHGHGRRGACGPPGQLPPSPGMCGQAHSAPVRDGARGGMVRRQARPAPPPYAAATRNSVMGWTASAKPSTCILHRSVDLSSGLRGGGGRPGWNPGQCLANGEPTAAGSPVALPTPGQHEKER